MANFPNLAGTATNDLIEKIGGGSFAASYINWSRTLQLLRQNAPGWTVETKEATDGGILFQAPVGGYLQLRVRHEDGTVGAWVPQAIMDNRNKAISYDKISARDITDTQRRGACLCLAYSFGLGAELWAKMKLEAGWGHDDEIKEAQKEVKNAHLPTPAPVVAAAAKASEVTEATFREQALERGLTTHAIDGLAEVLKGDWAKGVKTLTKKTDGEIDQLNIKYAPGRPGVDDQW